MSDRFVEVRPSSAEESWIRQGRGYLCLSYRCGCCGRNAFYKGISAGDWLLPTHRPPYGRRERTIALPPDPSGVWADLTKPPFSARSYVCGECKDKLERGD
jgi:hypothetical protein